MSDLIDRQAAIDALWKALYEYEDKTEKQFQESEDLDIQDWILHRIFVQNMSDIDRQTIIDLPSVQPDHNAEPGKMVADTISKQAAMERLMAQNVIMDGSEYHNGFNAGVNRAQEVIRNLPTVQPKCGHWMIEPTEEPEYCKCSECGYVNLIVEVFALDGYHYCPNCGAKMERSEDGTD